MSDAKGALAQALREIAYSLELPRDHPHFQTGVAQLTHLLQCHETRVRLILSNRLLPTPEELWLIRNIDADRLPRIEEAKAKLEDLLEKPIAEVTTHHEKAAPCQSLAEYLLRPSLERISKALMRIPEDSRTTLIRLMIDSCANWQSDKTRD